MILFLHTSSVFDSRALYRRRSLFLIFPVLYILFFGAVAFSRSSARASVLSAGGQKESELSELAASDEAGSDSRVQLEDFRRVEVKSGKPSWEVQARDAKFYPLDAIIHVNEAALKIFRDKDSDVDVIASAARLYRGESALNKASLDGNIRIELGDGLRVETESADFNAQQRVFEAAGKVSVIGKGFSIEGEGFRFFVESGIVSFSRNVRCSFEKGASIPKNLNVQ